MDVLRYRAPQEQQPWPYPFQQLRQQQQMQGEVDALADPANETREQAATWLSSNVDEHKSDAGKKALSEKSDADILGLAKTARAAARKQRDNPHDVPDKFLKEGKPDWQTLTNSYKELERVQFKRREDLRTEIQKEISEKPVEGLPTSPADYKIPKLKLEDGREVTIQNDHPMFQFFASTAHRLKIPDTEFGEMLSQYMKLEVGRGPNWTKESEALGEHAEGRLDRVDAWAQRNVPDDLYQVFNKIPASAGMVKLFEHIMTLSGEPAFALDSSNNVSNAPLSLEQLKEMQRDPKYWRDGDTQHIARVKAGFRRLAERNR